MTTATASTVGEMLIRLTIAGDALADATLSEMTYVDRKGIEKSAAIRRLMTTVNPETSREHSASSADKVVELDQDYAAFLSGFRDAVVQRIRASTSYDVAKLEAQLAVKLAAARAGEP